VSDEFYTRELKAMGRVLFLVFLIVPIVEIAIFIGVGQAIGLWPTLLGVVITALIGSALIRMQGLSLIRDIQRLMAAGVLPARQIADGVILAIAGALLLTPGYFTDLVGFLLLVPPVRTLIYQALKRRISAAAGFGAAQAGFSTPPDNGPSRGEGENINANVVELDQDNWRKET